MLTYTSLTLHVFQPDDQNNNKTDLDKTEDNDDGAVTKCEDILKAASEYLRSVLPTPPARRGRVYALRLE